MKRSTLLTEAANEVVKAAFTRPVRLYGLELCNIDGGRRFLQLFDLLQSQVELGVTKPTMVIGMGSVDNRRIMFPAGVSFSISCMYALTQEDTGSTGPVSSGTVTFLHD